MVTTEQWIHKISSLSQLSEETCTTIWNEVAKTTINRLSKNQDFVIPLVGRWHTEIQPSRIAVLPSNERYLLPPRMIPRLFGLSHSYGKDDLRQIVRTIPEIPAQTVEAFCQALETAFEECQENKLSLHWETLGTFGPKVIEDKTYYAFIPEASFVQKVNKPFELFAPTQIDNNLSWTDIPEEAIASLDEYTEIPYSLRNESDTTPKIEEEPTPYRETINLDSPTTIPVVEETPIPEPLPIPITSVEEEEHATVQEVPIAPKTTTEEDPNTESSYNLDIPTPSDVRQDFSQQLSGTRSSKNRSKTRFWIWILVVVLLISLIVAFGFFFYQKYQTTESIRQKIATTTPSLEIQESSSATKESEKAEISKDSIEEEIKAPNTLEKETIAREESAKYVKIEAGKNLAYYAKKHLGSTFFWIYIYRDNKDLIKDPDNIPIGTTIRIPSLRELQIDPNNEGHIKKAKELAFTARKSSR